MTGTQKTSRQVQEEAAAEWDRYADIWDSWTPNDRRDDAEEAADFLAELANGGTALELGIGTGRVALPLAERGVKVSGIDASPGMIRKLREKEGGDKIGIYEGNFADVDVKEDYDVIFIALATLFVLTTQEDQVRCFANSAAHLNPGGRLVVQNIVPDLTNYQRGRYNDFDTTAPFRVSGRLAGHPSMAWFEMNTVDPTTQTINRTDVIVSEKGNRIIAATMRFAWPPEQDLMGRLAGLELEGRWGGWHQERFTFDSLNSVSVYRKPTE
ncbi:class I SAM-dependent DNA methyltransferase [Streptomyces sp. H27-D2]|uniref:class I SAM-dependent DNA methyltransferase n=1 Tax=Streptomyces sp. H27-D2 TaxID=3046304 RepID=UPI002DB7C7EE|nr:class I SAM-dependent methyltransferase [Streptomyces sp. H27-D2]MEC4019152.1 class I SAM-dependent methyltransferase [Streptomyces sp. H27-D2]